MGGEIKDKLVIDICSDITQTMGKRYTNDKKLERRKLSTKERLRKKLLEKKEKEMLNKL